MENIYQAPTSDVQLDSESDSELRALRKLLSDQRIVLSPLLAFVSCTFFLVVILASGFSGFAFLLAIPSLLAGVVIRYLGRLIQLKHRIISALLSASATYFVLLGNPVIGAAVAAVGMLFFMAVSHRPLQYEQEKLVYKWQVGKLTP